jgi:hypothetical protein
MALSQKSARLTRKGGTRISHCQQQHETDGYERERGSTHGARQSATQKHIDEDQLELSDTGSMVMNSASILQLISTLISRSSIQLQAVTRLLE